MTKTGNLKIRLVEAYRLKKFTFFLIILLLFAMTSQGWCDLFDGDRRITDIVSDFYSFVSVGYLKYMDNSLLPNTHREMQETPQPERFKTLQGYYDMAHNVKVKKIKILVETLKMNGNSTDGQTVEVKVRYKIKHTDRKTGEVKYLQGKHKFIMKRWFRSWRISNIEVME